MRPWKVNADYEMELFQGKSGPLVMNQSLEFLCLYLESAPLLSSKKYQDNFLRHVEKVKGEKVLIISKGEGQNWWGKLQNLKLERELNSKITSAELIRSKGWCDRTYVIRNKEEAGQVVWDRDYIVKPPFGMSGRDFRLLPETLPLSEKLLALEKSPVVLEPFFQRKHDFSHYVFPDGGTICYQNLVDEKFQYKGTAFNSGELKFSKDISEREWGRFKCERDEVIHHYRSLGATEGFSIDSFVYEEKGELKIRSLSEVNYRRTMGSTAHELFLRYGKGASWGLLALGKFPGKVEFSDLIDRTSHLENVLVLSPGDVRFEMFFLFARNAEEGTDLFKKLRASLPECQFPIQL